VDVVVPFRGSRADLEDLRVRLGRLRLQPGDTVVVVDNTPDGDRGRDADPGGAGGAGQAGQAAGVAVLRAAERLTPGFARNRGVAGGSGDWLVFFDADTEPAEDLVERYFDPPPGPRTGLIGGGVRDEAVAADAPVAARYAHLRGLTSQDDSFRFGPWGFPKTANAACRRVAFEEVGGFREDIRAAEDADLTYRLKGAGWEVERREDAAVVHRSRRTVRALLVQKTLHGAGAAWLDRRYPGSFPPRRRPGLVWWAVRAGTTGLLSAARRRDRDQALWAVLDPLEQLAVEFGRLLPNERPLRGRWTRLPLPGPLRSRA
jgi:GT2 family glycosyltransferase